MPTGHHDLPTLSVIIIVKNEAENIGPCLDSVSFADEIVVLDSGSTDGTQDICRRYDKVALVETDWPGFGPQKNRALDRATGDWVLSVDADERVTPELAVEIGDAITNGAFDAYCVNRRNFFCGKAVRFAGWSPDWVTRLMRRGTGRFSDDIVHEKIVVNGKTGRLENRLDHYSYRTMDEVAARVQLYSDLGARQLHARGKTASRATAAMRGGWKFLRIYLLQLGFLEGVTGYRIAAYNGRSTYLKYAKLAAAAQGDQVR